jgi:hypothetical protein
MQDVRHMPNVIRPTSPYRNIPSPLRDLAEGVKPNMQRKDEAANIC